jgi:flagellar biosynthesis/type III secretory pathway chaperone
MISCKANSTEHLQGLLAGQLSLAAELEEVMRAKQLCLVRCDLSTLRELSEREQSVALQLSTVDAQRLAEAQRLAQLLSLHPDTVTASQVCAALPPGAEREQLAALGRVLSAKLALLYQLNDDNRVLAHHLLDYSAMVLRLLAHGQGSVSYGSDGRVSEGQPRAMLDDRV